MVKTDNSKALFSVCAAAYAGANGAVEAHVFAAKDPKKKFDTLMRAARAAVNGKPYKGAEYEAASTWLAGLVQRGQEGAVRLVVLEDGILGQNGTKIPKVKWERDLLALGVRLPVSGPQDRDAEMDGIRKAFLGAGIRVEPASIRALHDLKRQCSEAEKGCDYAWPEVTLSFNGRGHTHGQIMRLIDDLLRCCGYDLNMKVNEDGSAHLDMCGPDHDERARGAVAVTIGVCDEDGQATIGFVEGVPDDKAPQARLLSILGSVSPLLAWHQQLAESAVERDLAANPTVLDYAPPVRTIWHVPRSAEEMAGERFAFNKFKAVSEAEAKTYPPESVRVHRNTRYEDAPVLHLTAGRQWNQGDHVGPWELSDGTKIDGVGPVDGRRFLAWAKSVGEQVTYRSRVAA